MYQEKKCATHQKTENVHFSSHHPPRQPIATLNIAGSMMDKRETRDLGLTLDQYLTMSTH